MLIINYQPGWKDDFNGIKEILERALYPLEITIEHIGSTAVPGLPAKPIIDIDIRYEMNEDFSVIKQRLVKVGYFHNGDQGIPEREVFKRLSSSTHQVLDTTAHHLYVCRADSDELKRHLAFRDYLRKDEQARMDYQTLKYQIAEEAGQNKKIYAQIKEVKAKAFIESIVRKAQAHDL